MHKRTIAIIGCGAIGSALAEYADKELTPYISKIVLCDVEPARAEKLAGILKNTEIAGDMTEAAEKADLVVEAASGQVVPGLLKACIKKGKDIMVMSIGGLLGCEDLLNTVRAEKTIKILLPSGAVAGIDGLKSAKIAGIESVVLTTRKGPVSVKGAPYLLEKNIDVDNITEPTVIFDGNALEAIKGFPKNVNVSALLSIAGIGAEKTRVRIIVSPDYTRNIHEIEIKSKAGVITTRTENVPSPANPRTSYLAALAAITSLKGYFDTVRVGT